MCDVSPVIPAFGAWREEDRVQVYPLLDSHLVEASMLKRPILKKIDNQILNPGFHIRKVGL